MENEEITNSNLMQTDFARKERMAFLAAVPRENLPDAKTSRQVSSGNKASPALTEATSIRKSRKPQSDQRQPRWVQVWQFLKWAIGK